MTCGTLWQSMPSTGTLRTAIERRESVTLTYDRYLRFLSPHAIGTDNFGRRAVLGFQYGGGSPGGLRVTGEWVCIPIEAITSARLNGDTWHPGRGLRPPCLRETEVEAAARPHLI